MGRPTWHRSPRPLLDPKKGGVVGVRRGSKPERGIGTNGTSVRTRGVPSRCPPKGGHWKGSSRPHPLVRSVEERTDRQCPPFPHETEPGLLCVFRPQIARIAGMDPGHALPVPIHAEEAVGSPGTARSPPLAIVSHPPSVAFGPRSVGDGSQTSRSRCSLVHTFWKGSRPSGL